MITFLKYFGLFCLMVIAASLALCSFGVYKGVKLVTTTFEDSENYTCRQFAYDMNQPETDKIPAMLIAAATYGVKDVSDTNATEDETEFEGFEPAVRKMYELCAGNPDQRIVNLVAASITGQGISVSTTVPVATSPSTIPSPTTPQAGQ